MYLKDTPKYSETALSIVFHLYQELYQGLDIAKTGAEIEKELRAEIKQEGWKKSRRVEIKQDGRAKIKQVIRKKSMEGAEKEQEGRK